MPAFIAWWPATVLGSVTGPPIMLTVLRTPLYFDTSPGGILVSNDGTHLRVLGASGVGPVVILASSDLQAWEPILTNPPVIGTVEFIDSEVGSLSGRLYRALEGAVAGPLRIDIEPSLAPIGQRDAAVAVNRADGQWSRDHLRFLESAGLERRIHQPPDHRTASIPGGDSLRSAVAVLSGLGNPLTLVC